VIVREFNVSSKADRNQLSSGVTRVHVIRCSNWWRHHIFSWKTDDLL